jgi:hypothetical protein
MKKHPGAVAQIRVASPWPHDGLTKIMKPGSTGQTCWSEGWAPGGSKGEMFPALARRRRDEEHLLRLNEATSTIIDLGELLSHSSSLPP